jgi:triacylglycerol lipase
MLAGFQKLFVLGAVAFTLIWGVVWWQLGLPIWGITGMVVLVLGYAAVFGVEFALLWATFGTDPTIRPSLTELSKAWWGEVCSAPVVFGWRQPFRSAHLQDNLPMGVNGRRGLLLVHGFVCNRGLWNAWLARLKDLDVPFVAVNLEPVFGSIDDYAATLESAMRQLEDCTACPPVVVAHSMGGLAVRRWWADQADNARVFRLITIATPHRGTWLARFAFSKNGAQMRQQSAWLQRLASQEPVNRAALCTCFYGHCDNIVFPPSTATLPGADNRHLPGVAHVHMVDHPAPWQETLRWLDASIHAGA